MRRRARILALLLLLAVAGLVAWLTLRPNAARVDPRLGLEHWVVISDGEHNSNTDLILYQGEFLLAHAASPYHLGTPESRLLIKRSSDARSWETLATLNVAGMDIRDPKLAVIAGRLFLYALPNDSVYATPEHTVYATSRDGGRTWSDFQPLANPGWLFWRPKTRDGRVWYVSAYWHDHGASILLRSSDGVNWSEVAQLYEGEANDETAIEFLPDGRMLASARLEVTADSFLGHPDASTMLMTAPPPYTQWTRTRSRVTRLDGPILFRHAGQIFAVARFQPNQSGPFSHPASVLARKRTSLFRLEPDRIVWLSDLPSAGDTAYAGVVLHEGALWVEWYTSRVDRDWPWLLGMFLPSEIRMGRIPLDALTALSDATP
jgi:hypothetical protein